MTLGFSIKFPNGQLTHFPEKIWSASIKGEFLMRTATYVPDLASKFHPKIHTCREYKEHRWKPGRIINCVLFNRTPRRYEFATIKCISVQRIEIYNFSDGSKIFVDGRRLNKEEVTEFILNDGFDNAAQFRLWFKESWKGTLIHFTDKRY